MYLGDVRMMKMHYEKIKDRHRSNLAGIDECWLTKVIGVEEFYSTVPFAVRLTSKDE